MSVMHVCVFASLIWQALCYPVHIGCDLTVVTGKTSQGRNVMTTTDSIMGATPVTDNNLATSSVSEFSSGSTVTISFSAAFERGIAHATAGILNDGGTFAASPTAGATACTSPQTIKYKNSGGTTADITWTAPVDVSATSSVVLSFAAAGGFGTVSRTAITLTRADATTDTTTTMADTTTTMADTTMTTMADTTTTMADTTTTMADTTMTTMVDTTTTMADTTTTIVDATTSMADTTTTMADTTTAMADTTTTMADATTPIAETTTTLAGTTLAAPTPAATTTSESSGSGGNETTPSASVGGAAATGQATVSGSVFDAVPCVALLTLIMNMLIV